MSPAPPLAVEALQRIARGLPAFETTAILPSHLKMRRDAITWLLRRGFVMRTESPMGEPRAYTRIPAVCGRRKAGAMAPALVVPLVTDTGREFLSTL